MKYEHTLKYTIVNQRGWDGYQKTIFYCSWIQKWQNYTVWRWVKTCTKKWIKVVYENHSILCRGEGDEGSVRNNALSNNIWNLFTQIGIYPIRLKKKITKIQSGGR